MPEINPQNSWVVTDEYGYVDRMISHHEDTTYSLTDMDEWTEHTDEDEAFLVGRVSVPVIPERAEELADLLAQADFQDPAADLIEDDGAFHVADLEEYIKYEHKEGSLFWSRED